MSLKLAAINNARTTPLKDRAKILALAPDLVYNDGRTKQCHKDECDINKIMARFEKTGTISHMAKYEVVYADFSDYDFHAHITKLAQGREVFDDLPGELRKEFAHSPQAFFEYVNDPANADELREKLTGLAKPGNQLPSADREAALAAASEPVASVTATPLDGDTPST